MQAMRNAARLFSQAAVLSLLLLLGAVFSGSLFGTGAQAAMLRGEANLNSPLMALSTKEAAADMGLTSLVPAASWSEVASRDQEAFFKSYHFSINEGEFDPDENPLIAYVNTGSSSLNVRTGPGTAYTVLDKVPGGTRFEVYSGSEGWYEVTWNGANGYVSGDHVLLMTQSEYETFRTPATPGSNGNYSELGNQIAEYALGYLGCKYVYGANGPDSFDCSGFVKYVYAQFGYSLNRTASDQLNNGTVVEKGSEQPGDLVFFKRSGESKPVSHVGMYIGNGQFVHASTNQYKVRIDNLFTGYYEDIYIYARHII